jgi:hypothetical protein
MPVADQEAKCQWGGDRFLARYTGLDEGSAHLMIALENAARFTVGTQIAVSDSEIVEWLPPPPPPADGP